jgi:ribulose-phosphate 3-epimerase
MLSKIILFQEINYELARFIMSGFIFIIAYNFHIKFSFRRNKKVGVAIYLDKNENINDIFSKVGFHPDYIHIDMVDKTMNSNVSDPDLSKFDEVKRTWPNHKIESHIMSKNPTKYVDKFAAFSDVIYFHNEINEDKQEVKELISAKGVKSGIVIHASKNYENIANIIKNFDEILLLCIDKPGESGQKFINKAFNLIDEINSLIGRSKFLLCVDGGLSQDNIKKIDCDKIVSASNVFKSLNPKKQIISLQKTLNN